MPGPYATNARHPSSAPGPHIPAATKVKHLPERMRLPASFLEELWQGDDFWQYLAETRVVSENSRLLGPQSGQQAAATRITDRILNIGTLKGGAPRSQPVQTRSFHDLPGERSAEITKIIGHDQQHVQPNRLGRQLTGGPRARSSQEDDGENGSDQRHSRDPCSRTADARANESGSGHRPTPMTVGRRPGDVEIQGQSPQRERGALRKPEFGREVDVPVRTGPLCTTTDLAREFAIVPPLEKGCSVGLLPLF